MIVIGDYNAERLPMTLFLLSCIINDRILFDFCLKKKRVVI